MNFQNLVKLVQNPDQLPTPIQATTQQIDNQRKEILYDFSKHLYQFLESLSAAFPSCASTKTTFLRYSLVFNPNLNLFNIPNCMSIMSKWHQDFCPYYEDWMNRKIDCILQIENNMIKQLNLYGKYLGLKQKADAEKDTRDLPLCVFIDHINMYACIYHMPECIFNIVAASTCHAQNNNTPSIDIPQIIAQITSINNGGDNIMSQLTAIQSILPFYVKYMEKYGENNMVTNLSKELLSMMKILSPSSIH